MYSIQVLMQAGPHDWHFQGSQLKFHGSNHGERHCTIRYLLQFYGADRRDMLNSKGVSKRLGMTNRDYRSIFGVIDALERM